MVVDTAESTTERKKKVGLKMVPDDWTKEGKMLKGKKAPLL